MPRRVTKVSYWVTDHPVPGLPLPGDHPPLIPLHDSQATFPKMAFMEWRDPFPPKTLRERTDCYVCAKVIHTECRTLFAERKTKRTIQKRNNSHWQSHTKHKQPLVQVSSFYCIPDTLDALVVDEDDQGWLVVSSERKQAICVIGETKRRINARKSIHKVNPNSKLLRDATHGAQRKLTDMFQQQSPVQAQRRQRKRRSVAEAPMPPAKKKRRISSRSVDASSVDAAAQVIDDSSVDERRREAECHENEKEERARVRASAVNRKLVPTPKKQQILKQHRAPFLEQHNQFLESLCDEFRLLVISDFNFLSLLGETPKSILRHPQIAQIFRHEAVTRASRTVQNVTCDICRRGYACNARCKTKMCCPGTNTWAHHAVSITEAQMNDKKHGAELLQEMRNHVRTEQHLTIEQQHYDLDLQNRVCTYLMYQDALMIVSQGLPHHQIEALAAGTAKLGLNGNTRGNSKGVKDVAKELFEVVKLMTARVLRRPSNAQILPHITWMTLFADTWSKRGLKVCVFVGR